MSQRVAAESCPPPKMVVVREFDEERDKAAVEEMERRCEIGPRGKPSLVTDLMGDPICRIRHFPSHVMLVSKNNITFRPVCLVYYHRYLIQLLLSIQLIKRIIYSTGDLIWEEGK